MPSALLLPMESLNELREWQQILAYPAIPALLFPLFQISPGTASSEHHYRNFSLLLLFPLLSGFWHLMLEKTS